LYKLIILEEADREFQEAVKWYEDRSTGWVSGSSKSLSEN
jgi:hypothetical protein